MACCALIAALFGSAVRRMRRSPAAATPVATAQWSAGINEPGSDSRPERTNLAV